MLHRFGVYRLHRFAPRVHWLRFAHSRYRSLHFQIAGTETFYIPTAYARATCAYVHTITDHHIEPVELNEVEMEKSFWQKPSLKVLR